MTVAAPATKVKNAVSRSTVSASVTVAPARTPDGPGLREGIC